MLDTPPPSGTTPEMVSLISQERKVRPRLIKGHDYYWSGFIRGCRMAGLLWLSLIICGFIVYRVVIGSGLSRGKFSGLSSLGISGFILSLLSYAVFSWIAGRTAKTFRFFNHYPTSLGGSLMTATLGGGIVGFMGGLAMACFMDISFILMAFPDHWLQIWCLVLGTSTVVCQMGGALGVRQQLSKQLVAGEELILLRFRIRHLLVATMCCAMLLGIFKSLNLLNSTLVTVIGFWCFLQSCGLSISGAISKYLNKKYLAVNVPRETIS